MCNPPTACPPGTGEKQADVKSRQRKLGEGRMTIWGAPFVGADEVRVMMMV